MHESEGTERTFKTAWFSKAARKALITDDDLCEAMRAVRKGQADDLADLYAQKTDDQIERELEAREIVEICT